MNVPTANVRHSRAGFTMLELLVVISILIVAVLVFATFLGPGATGPALERGARGIRAMVANVRQNSSIRKVHSELVLDYRNDQVVALARRRLVSFAFDGQQNTVGSGNVIGVPSAGALIQASRTYLLRDGAALELPDSQASFTVPWMDHYDVAGDYEGIAVSFDFFPLAGTPGNVVTMGSVFNVSVAAARDNAVKLAVSSGGVTATSDSWVALYRWCTVEIATSRYGVSIYVDGRVNEGQLPSSGFSVPSAMGTDTRIGGVPCRIDNFEMNSLISSQTLDLGSVQLVVPGVSPQLEAEGAAEGIYDAKPQGGPTTGGGTAPAPPPGLPDGPVPAIVHVHFDTSGKLDPARHDGAAFIYLIAVEDGEIVRMVVTIHTLGAVTWDYVDRFPWEPPPAPPPKASPKAPGNTP